jgi:hypothetical protein
MYANLSRGLWYSMILLGIGGRGSSFSVESSLSGLPQRYRSNSASFVTVAGTGRPSESVLLLAEFARSSRTEWTMIAMSNGNPTSAANIHKQPFPLKSVTSPPK